MTMDPPSSHEQPGGLADSRGDLQSLIVAAAESPRCPSCRVLARLLYDRMCELQLLAVRDPTWRDRLRDVGLCCDHLWYLFDLTSSSAVAALATTLVERVAEEALTLSQRLAADPTLVRRGGAIVTGMLGARACLACASMDAWNTALTDAVVSLLGVDDMGPATRLCVPHLASVVERLPASQASALLCAWADSARSLAGQLRVVTDNAERHARSLGPERRAPIEAIARLAGGRGGGKAPR